MLLRYKEGRDLVESCVAETQQQAGCATMLNALFHISLPRSRVVFIQKSLHSQGQCIQYGGTYCYLL
jgi:hypothetical protein